MKLSCRSLELEVTIEKILSLRAPSVAAHGAVNCDTTTEPCIMVRNLGMVTQPFAMGVGLSCRCRC